MKKRNLNMIEAIVQGVTILIVLFGTYGLVHCHEEVYAMNFRAMSQRIPIWCYLLLALLVSNLCICFSSYVKNLNEKDGKLHVLLPIINFGYTLTFRILAPMLAYREMWTDVGSSYKYSNTMNIILVLQFVIIILGFMKRSDKSLSNNGQE